MIQKPILNELEHLILTSHADDIEPLLVLYQETKKHIKTVTIDHFVSALIKLMDLGFSKCVVPTGSNLLKCNKITERELRERLTSQLLDKKLKNDLLHSKEYYFKITQAGKIENVREIYNSNYS